MPAPRSKRRWLLVALAALAACGAVPGSVAVVDHLESDPAFCNACHLPNGTPLHRLKLELARDTPPLDLTALHFNPPHRTRSTNPGGDAKRFSCADCHRGYGWQRRSRVLWESAFNTFRYAVLPFQEPDRLVIPLSNASCEACHPGVQSDRDSSRYHGIKAHLDQVTVNCIECHRGHAPSKKPHDQVTALMAAMTRTCRRCHKGEELSPPVTHMLGAVRGKERARLGIVD